MIYRLATCFIYSVYRNEIVISVVPSFRRFVVSFIWFYFICWYTSISVTTVDFRWFLSLGQQISLLYFRFDMTHSFSTSSTTSSIYVNSFLLLLMEKYSSTQHMYTPHTHTFMRTQTQAHTMNKFSFSMLNGASNAHVIICAHRNKHMCWAFVEKEKSKNYWQTNFWQIMPRFGDNSFSHRKWIKCWEQWTNAIIVIFHSYQWIIYYFYFYRKKYKSNNDFVYRQLVYGQNHQALSIYEFTSFSYCFTKLNACCRNVFALKIRKKKNI